MILAAARNAAVIFEVLQVLGEARKELTEECSNRGVLDGELMYELSQLSCVVDLDPIEVLLAMRRIVIFYAKRLRLILTAHQIDLRRIAVLDRVIDIRLNLWVFRRSVLLRNIIEICLERAVLTDDFAVLSKTIDCVTNRAIFDVEAVMNELLPLNEFDKGVANMFELACPDQVNLRS